MVVHIDQRDYYRRGCNDGTSFILALVLICSIVALVLTNYLDSWPVYMPVLVLVAAVLNMIVFSSSPLARFQSERTLILFMVVHGVCLLAVVIFLALLVTQTPLFLSDDCNNCSLDWQTKNDEVCGRAMTECRGTGKFRFGIFVLFPLGSASLVMEIVNLVSALVAWVHLKRKVK
jgi:hypothetical protein